MDGFRENGLKRRRKWRCKVRRIDWGFIGVMVFFAVLMCLIALGIVGFVENERNSIQCGIVVDKDYTAAYSSYRYDADTGRSSSTSHGPQYRICIEGEKNGAIVQYWFSATEEEYARSRIGEFFAR